MKEILKSDDDIPIGEIRGGMTPPTSRKRPRTDGNETPPGQADNASLSGSQLPNVVVEEGQFLGVAEFDEEEQSDVGERGVKEMIRKKRRTFLEKC